MENMHKRHVPLKGVSALILRCLIAIKYLRICRSIPTRDYSDCTFVQTNRGPSPVVHFILCFKVCFPVRDRSIRLLSRDTTNHILLDYVQPAFNHFGVQVQSGTSLSVWAAHTVSWLNVRIHQALLKEFCRFCYTPANYVVGNVANLIARLLQKWKRLCISNAEVIRLSKLSAP